MALLIPGVAAVAAMTTVALAAPGQLDRDFGKRGWALTDFRGHNDFGNDMAVQRNGRAVVVGGTRLGGQKYDFAVARYRRGGAIDRSFGRDGTRHLSFGPDSRASEVASAVAIQANGKIVVAGWTAAAGDNEDLAIARYTKDGRLDRSFSGNGKLVLDLGNNDNATAVTIGGSGRILVAGGTTQATGAEEGFVLLRLRRDGNLDRSFAGDGVAQTDFGGGAEWAWALVQRPDGRTLVAGEGTPGGAEAMVVARYTRRGTLDTTFSDDGWAMVEIDGERFESAAAIAVQDDGAIILAGGGLNRDFIVARLDGSGAPDTSFSGDGQLRTDIGGHDHAYDVALQPSGGIIVAGQAEVGPSNQSRLAVTRYQRSGKVDRRFTDAANGALARAPGEQLGRAVDLQGRGRVLVAGTAERRGTLEDFALVRLRTR